jgi:hypothetical protein
MPDTFHEHTRTKVPFCVFKSYYDTADTKKEKSFDFLRATYNGIDVGVEYVRRNPEKFPDIVLEPVEFDLGVTRLDTEYADINFDSSAAQTF